MGILLEIDYGFAIAINKQYVMDNVVLHCTLLSIKGKLCYK